MHFALSSFASALHRTVSLDLSLHQCMGMVHLLRIPRLNQVQFAEIRSPMESTIGIKRSCKSQKENRSPDGPDKEGAEMIQLPFHVLKEIPGNLSE